MDVTPIGRTAPSAFYAQYLLSDAWRRVRNHKLREVKWTCEKCGSKRNLQVHHTTYERLGAEWSTDLKVLCEGCHEGEHPRERQHDYLRHYLVLARELLRKQPTFESSADLADALKFACSKAKIPYDSEKLGRALDILTRDEDNVIVPAAAEPLIQRVFGQPPSAHEARQILRNLGFDGCLKSMPSVGEVYDPDKAEREARRLRELDMEQY